jgi:hypothetical protein
MDEFKKPYGYKSINSTHIVSCKNNSYYNQIQSFINNLLTKINFSRN